MSDPTEILDGMKARADAIPKAEWQPTYGDQEYPRVWGSDENDLEPIVVVLGFLDSDTGRAVADFIAAARTEHPTMVELLQQTLKATETDGEDHAEGYRAAMAQIRTIVTTGLQGINHDEV
ncbi:hypothetical protein LG293_15815 (plasmid) [Citricoccus nitrophenolicus]